MSEADSYGWLVVLATFFVGFITDGILFSFGVLLIELLQTFDQGRASTVIVASIVTGVMHLIGPVAGMLSERYGCRVVVIAGSLISSLGFIISVFVDKLVYLYITYGFLGGLGFGLMYLPASVCVLQHFVHSKRRSLANGISMCGSGAGSFVFNLLTGFLLEKYGWRGTILIEAGILLNGVAFGLILVSPKVNTDNPSREYDDLETIHREVIITDRNDMAIELEQQKHDKNGCNLQHLNSPEDQIETGNDVSNSLLISTGNGIIKSRDVYEVSEVPASEKDVMLEDVSDDPKAIDSSDKSSMHYKARSDSISNDKSICNKCTLIDLSLLRNTKLLAFLCNGFLVNLAFTIPINFIPDQAVESGMSKQQAFWLASSIGITNTISRIIVGWVADRKFVNRLVLLEVLLFSVGIVTALSVLLESFTGKMVYTCVYGFLIGGFVATCPVLLSDLFGVEVIARSYGLLMFSVGISGLISSPIAGWLFDHTGSYVTSFIAAGSEFILAACVFALPFLIERFYKRNQK